MKLPHWVQRQMMRKERIYIMPTRMGGYLNALLFLMFLLAIGYSNNLLLIFTLFLFGLNLLWLIQTHFHLHALKLAGIQFEDGHAGDDLSVRINWKKSPEGPHHWELSLHTPLPETIKLRPLAHSATQSDGHLTFPKRGLWKFNRLCIRSEKPFGLYRAWIYLRIDVEAYAYPRRLRDVPPIEKEVTFLEGDQAGSRTGPHDVRNLAPYQGEEARRISWKHYARSGELVVKEGEELQRGLVRFRIREREVDLEHLLARIATQMVYCARGEIAFGLETPARRLGPAISAKHLAECLRELAVC